MIYKNVAEKFMSWH